MAVARVLRGRGHDVVLWLAGRNVERTSLAGWDGKVVSIKAAGFPAGLSLRSAGIAARLLWAAGRCLGPMRRFRPEALLAMGSYASVGPVLAARMCRIPVVLHEANAVPGRAVSLLAKVADAVGVTFDAAAVELGAKSVRTGLPIRGDLHPHFPEGKLARDQFTVLLMGGSQGAHVLNDVGSQAVCALRAAGRRIQAVHLTGSADEPVVRSRYVAGGVPHLVFPFLEDMGLAYGAGDLAICRAGAASCMELVAFRMPALLVPLPSARRDHQTANARAMAAAGAAEWVRQDELSVPMLCDYLDAYMGDPDRARTLREGGEKLAVPDAAERLASLVESCAGLTRV